MKRLTLILCVLAAAIATAFLPVLPASASDGKTLYRIVIEDDADLLTDAEEAKLYQEMSAIAEYANVAFHTVDGHDYSGTKAYAESYYVSTFGGGTNGTVFLIDLDRRNLWIVSDGAAYRSITTNRANIITDNVYTYASRKEYYECASKAFSQMLAVLEGERIAAPMKTVGNALLAVAASLLIMFLVVKSVANPKKPTAAELAAFSAVAFEAEEPRTIHTGTTRRYDPPAKSSGGGGGFSGGGGGGGGFSGGGGGHSF